MDLPWKIFKHFAIETGQASSLATEPYISGLILYQAADPVMAQSVFSSNLCEGFAIITPHSPAAAAKPNVSNFVLKQWRTAFAYFIIVGEHYKRAPIVVTYSIFPGADPDGTIAIRYNATDPVVTQAVSTI